MRATFCAVRVLLSCVLCCCARHLVCLQHGGTLYLSLVLCRAARPRVRDANNIGTIVVALPFGKRAERSARAPWFLFLHLRTLCTARHGSTALRTLSCWFAACICGWIGGLRTLALLCVTLPLVRAAYSVVFGCRDGCACARRAALYLCAFLSRISPSCDTSSLADARVRQALARRRRERRRATLFNVAWCIISLKRL